MPHTVLGPDRARGVMYILCRVLRSYQFIYFLDFKVVKWPVSSLTHSSNPFEYYKYVYFNIHYSHVTTAEFLAMSAETTCSEIERK